MPGPRGLRGHPSMVRSVGRGLDPSAGGNPGMGGGGRLRRGGALRGAQRAGPTSNFYVSIVGAAYMPPAGFTRAPVPGPPHGRGRACPARGGLRGHPSRVRPVGRGLDPSAGGCPGDGRWRKAARGVGDAAPYGLPGTGRRREVAPHPALRGHLPPRGKAGVVGEGFIPPGVLAATRISAGRRGRRPLRVVRERAAPAPHPAHISTGV